MDDGVQVQGPDGQQYSFPAGTDKNAAIAYFKKKGIGGAPATSQSQGTGAPQTQPSGTSADTSSPSLLSRAGKFLNTGLVSGKALFNAVANGGNAMSDSMDAESGNYHDPTPPIDYYSQANKYANSQSLADADHPVWSGIKKGLAHAATDTADVGSAFTSPASIALMGSGALGKAIPAISTLAKTIQGAAGAYYGVKGAGDIHSAVTNTDAPMADRLQQGLMGGAQVAGGAAGAADTVKGAVPAIGNLLRDLTDPAQRVTNMGRTDALTQISNARQNFADHVGKVINGINAADYQQSGGTRAVSVAPVVSKIADIDKTFKATPDTTPLYWEARQSLLDSNAPDSKMFMKEVHDLKQKVGENFADSPDGSKDRAATSQLLNSVDDVMAKRAEDLGQTKQFDYYRTKWRTLKTMESPRGILGQLDNTGDSAGPASIDPRAGKKFFDILRDPHNTAAVNDAVADLSQFGLNKNFVADLTDQYGAMHNYLKAQDITLMNQNRKPSLMRAGIIGVKRGYAKVNAASALPNFDIPPAGSGPKVDYVGDGTAPDINPIAPNSSIRPPSGGNGSTAAMAQQATQTAMDKTRAPEYGGQTQQTQESAASTVDTKELADIGQALGLKKADAIARAKEAAAAHPNDFEAAKYYMAGRKAEAISTVKQAMQMQPDKPAQEFDPQAANNDMNAGKNMPTLAQRIQAIKDEAAASRKRRQN